MNRDDHASRRRGISERRWTFLTNHAQVLLLIARDPGARLSDIADAVGITERRAFGIVRDLETEGYITRDKRGRRNYYELHPQRPLRHPLQQHEDVSALLDLVTPPPSRSGTA